MEISIQVRGADRDVLRLLLATAPEIGIPITEVRTSPLGLLIPVELAVHAGLLDKYCTPAEPVKAAPKRTRSAKAKEVIEQTEALWEE